jgi:hypothetical protein
MSPCPYQARNDHRHQHRVRHHESHSGLAYVRAPQVHQPSSLCSLLRNALFPMRSVADLRNSRYQRVDRHSKSRRGHGGNPEPCDECHQTHEINATRKKRGNRDHNSHQRQRTHQEHDTHQRQRAYQGHNDRHHGLLPATEPPLGRGILRSFVADASPTTPPPNPQPAPSRVFFKPVPFSMPNRGLQEPINHMGIVIDYTPNNIGVAHLLHPHHHQHSRPNAVVEGAAIPWIDQRWSPGDQSLVDRDFMMRGALPTIGAAARPPSDFVTGRHWF